MHVCDRSLVAFRSEESEEKRRSSNASVPRLILNAATVMSLGPGDGEMANGTLPH